jgi:hypothetical protein
MAAFSDFVSMMPADLPDDAWDAVGPDYEFDVFDDDKEGDDG